MEKGNESQHSVIIFTTPYLPLLNIRASPVTHSPPHSGKETPPLQTSASVPFRWEEKPGKPRSLAGLSGPIKGLELDLPPSPTAVLNGPYNVDRPKFSSFRFFRDSFDSYSSASPLDDAALVGTKCRGGAGLRAKEFLGRSLRWKIGKREDDDEIFNGGRTKKVKVETNSGRNVKPTRLWASICEGVKQVIVWKRATKSKKDDRV